MLTYDGGYSEGLHSVSACSHCVAIQQASNIVTDLFQDQCSLSLTACVIYCSLRL